MACQQTTQCHSSSCFLYAAGLVLGGAAIGYFIGFKNGTKKARMNTKIQLGNATLRKKRLCKCSEWIWSENNEKTVIDAVDAKDIGEQKGFCRCWKSEKFPYCDGAHVKHNQETGDNVGPLVVKGKR